MNTYLYTLFISVLAQQGGYLVLDSYNRYPFDINNIFSLKSRINQVKQGDGSTLFSYMSQKK